MGFLSGLFGGGTKVTQTAQQKTTVQNQVDVNNKIDVSTEAIAKVLADFGSKVNASAQDTKTLVAQIAQMNGAQLVAEYQFNDLLRKRTKQAGLLLSGGFAWWMYSKKKRAKKR